MGGFNRILVDLVDLVGLPAGFLVDFLVDFSVRVLVDCIPLGFQLVGRIVLYRHLGACLSRLPPGGLVYLSVGCIFDTVIPPFEVRCSVDDLDSNRLLISIVAP